MTRRYGTTPSDYRPTPRWDPARPEPESALEKQYRRMERRGYYTPERTDERADYLAYEDRMWAEEARAMREDDDG